MVATISAPKPVDIFLSGLERQARREEWGRGEERKRDGTSMGTNLTLTVPEFRGNLRAAYRTHAFLPRRFHKPERVHINLFTPTPSDIGSLALVVRAPSKGCL